MNNPNLAQRIADEINAIRSEIASDILLLNTRLSDFNTLLNNFENIFSINTSEITSSAVGLGNVDNTSDLNKPISTSTQTALNLKAPLNNPTFTGVVNGVFNGNITGTATTVPITNNSVEIATTAAVHGIFTVNGSTLTINA